MTIPWSASTGFQPFYSQFLPPNLAAVACRSLNLGFGAMTIEGKEEFMWVYGSRGRVHNRQEGMAAEGWNRNQGITSSTTSAESELEVGRGWELSKLSSLLDILQPGCTSPQPPRAPVLQCLSLWGAFSFTTRSLPGLFQH